MKTIVGLLCALLMFQCVAIHGQNRPESSITTFQLIVDSDKVNTVAFSKYDFETGKMFELKSLKDLSHEEIHKVVDPFLGPSIYSVKLNIGKEVRIAVEKGGVIRLHLGESISIESNVAKKSDFEKSIQELNDQFFSNLIRDYEQALKDNNETKIQQLEIKKDEILTDFIIAMENLVKEMGPSALAYDALQYFDLHKSYDFLKEMATKFQAYFPGYAMSKALQSRVDKAAQLAIGREAPTFTAQELQGTKLNLANFRGSYLLIDFWASWCRACRVENPKFVDIYKAYKDIGFEVLSISQDSDVALWKKAIEKDRLPWSNILDTDRFVWNLYQLSSLPSNFLLDPEGRIISKNINADRLENQLNHLLSE